MTRYYFLIATQDFLLYQEPVEEILRERIRHYKILKKKIDFCLTTDLLFLNKSNLLHIKQQVVKPSAAIISANPKFINWLKLRIHYGITGSFISDQLVVNNNLIDTMELSFL